MTLALRTLKDLSDLSMNQGRAEYNIQPERPGIPAMLKVTGLKFGYRVEWSQVASADGYRVAVMTANNLGAPDNLSPLIEGSTTLFYTWFVGDVAILRYFSVQSFKRTLSGEIIYSDFRYPLVSATSKVDGGVADSAPGASPSAPVSPGGPGDPGNPGGIGRTQP